MLAPKSALRKTVGSNAPASARRPKPDARDEPVTNPTQDASLHVQVSEVAEHQIGQVVKSKTRQTEAVERLHVPTAPGKKFEVHASQACNSSSHAATLCELVVKLGIELAENLLPT